jgi:hypothetical protein
MNSKLFNGLYNSVNLSFITGNITILFPFQFSFGHSPNLPIIPQTKNPTNVGVDGHYIYLQSVSISIISISLLTIPSHFTTSSFILFKLGKIATGQKLSATAIVAFFLFCLLIYPITLGEYSTIANWFVKSLVENAVFIA